MIRLLHLSDIHFGAEHPAALAAATDYARSKPGDLLIVSGDITQDGLVDEFARAADWLAGLAGPRLIVPGNHDTPLLGLADRLFRPFQRFERAWGPSDAAAFSRDGLVVHGANTARGAQIRLNWSKGAISRPQIRAAVSRLSEAPPDALKVFVVHHPLTEVEGEPMTGRVRGGARAQAALAKAGVDLILSGHIHAPFAHSLDPFGDPAPHAVGAGTLSDRLRGAPPGFNVIEADADTVTTTALGWTGAALEVQHVWRWARRSALNGNLPEPSVLAF